MDNYIFSNSLILEDADEKVNVRKPHLLEIEKIREGSTTDVYLCGGGIFAGWLLDNEKVDILKLKINPFLLGEGVRLFGDSKKSYQYLQGEVLNIYIFLFYILEHTSFLNSFKLTLGVYSLS